MYITFPDFWLNSCLVLHLGEASRTTSRMMQPTKRLRTKTPPPRMVQEPVAMLEDFAAQEDPKARRRSFLVTIPHPTSPWTADGYQLRPPETCSKQVLLEAFLDACAHPDYQDRKSRLESCTVKPDKVGVFKELHRANADGHIHGHAHLAVAFLTEVRFLPLKRALLHRHGLASHWSAHEGYFSTIRYCWWPSPSKLESSLDKSPLMWAQGRPHPPLDECCHEPITALALRKRRTHAERRAAEEGKKEPRVTESDVYAIVVQKGFKNTPDDRTAHKQLIAHVKAHSSKAMWDYSWKNRARLSAVIDDVWQWEHIEASLAQERASRMELLKAAAAADCVCKGQWLAAVAASFIANGIDVRALCSDVLQLLDNGRAPGTPVLVLAGKTGGEGKSLFLKALISVFGDAQVLDSPVPGNFPLLGLLDSKVCFFDEWRFDTSVLPWSLQCVLYDGSNVTVNRPQNVAGQVGHVKYRGTSPIFVTTKLSDIEQLAKWAALDPTTGKPGDSEASMIYRRLKVYPFCTKIQPPPPGLPYCGKCFAQLVMQQGSMM